MDELETLKDYQLLDLEIEFNEATDRHYEHLIIHFQSTHIVIQVASQNKSFCVQLIDYESGYRPTLGRAHTIDGITEIIKGTHRYKDYLIKYKLKQFINDN